MRMKEKKATLEERDIAESAFKTRYYIIKNNPHFISLQFYVYSLFNSLGIYSFLLWD